MIGLTLIVIALALIGLIALSCYLFDNFKSLVSIIASLMRPFFQPQESKSLIDRFGNWAVITGSTDGIGRQYAHELAKQGINIVLISRTESKLVQVANEIEAKYPVKTKWIVADFSQGEAIYDHIMEELKGIDVGILVNNVGRNFDSPDDLDNIPEKLIWDIININVGAATYLTRLVLPQMKKKRKGAIVNISSGSNLQPLPYMSVYAATKAYVKSFTLALQYELEPFNITVQLVSPLFVQTKMNSFSQTVMTAKNPFIPDVESYTKFAVFTLGKTNVTTGYWAHGVQYGAMKLVPEYVRTLFGYKMNIDFRNEFQKNNKVS